MDADKITFRAKVGFPNFENPIEEKLIFRLMLQEGDDFPVLSALDVPYDRELKVMEVDLTPFRGRNKFLILSVESPDTNANPVHGAWVEPKLYYQFF